MALTTTSFELVAYSYGTKNISKKDLAKIHEEYHIPNNVELIFANELNRVVRLLDH